MKTSLLAIVAGVVSAGNVVELTPQNWKSIVKDSGKGTFIKFYAPWCGHCKTLAPIWEKLGKKFKNSEAVTIAEIDCTAAGEPLCQQNGVKGYPTIKYWKNNGKGGLDYQGGREMNDLKAFVEGTFKASCDPKTKKGCSDKEVTFIDNNINKSLEELQELLAGKEADLKAVKKEKRELEAKQKEDLKKFKGKETALNKAVALAKLMIKSAPKAEL